MPGWLRRRVELGDLPSVALYQVLGAAVLALLAVPVYRLVVGVMARWVRALMRWRGVPAEGPLVAEGVRPVGWLAVAWVFVRGVSALDLPAEASGVVLAVLVPALWLAAYAAFRLIDPALQLVAGPAETPGGAASLAAMGYPVLALVLKIVVVVCGLAAVLDLFDFDVATVLTGLGIGGVAVALAAQDTLKNLFGSVMLIADRTFRVGDLVKIGEHEGVVESVGPRTTRLRGPDDSLLTVPNSDLTTMHVTNFGARRFRRFRTQITVAHGTPADVLDRFRDGILGLIRESPQVCRQKYEVAVNDWGSSGVVILVQVFFELIDAHAELVARDALILQILRLAERLGVSFDSPTMVLERGHPAQAGTNGGNSVPTSPS